MLRGRAAGINRHHRPESWPSRKTPDPFFMASPDTDAALLPHELLNVVRPAGTAASRSAGLPAAEGIDSGPGARRGAGLPVRVGDAGLDAIEEPLDLAIVLRKNARGQSVLRVVGQIDRGLECEHVTDDRDRHEQL